METKADRDGLYDEMLNILKQLFSMNIINQEQLENFIFNNGKWAGSQLRWSVKPLRRSGNLLGEPRSEPLRRWMRFQQSRESKPTKTVEAKQQLLAKKVYNPITTNLKEKEFFRYIKMKLGQLIWLKSRR